MEVANNTTQLQFEICNVQTLDFIKQEVTEEAPVLDIIEPQPKKDKKEPKEPPREAFKKKAISTFIPSNCHLCKEEFANFALLEKHCQAEHNCLPEVSCICGKNIENAGKFARHKRKCGGPHFAPYQ